MPRASLNLPRCCIEGTSVLRLENARMAIHISYHLALALFFFPKDLLNKCSGIFLHITKSIIFSGNALHTSCIETVS